MTWDDFLLVSTVFCGFKHTLNGLEQLCEHLLILVFWEVPRFLFGFLEFCEFPCFSWLPLLPLTFCRFLLVSRNCTQRSHAYPTIGGLRSPNMGVARKQSFQQVGSRVRSVIAGFISNNPYVLDVVEGFCSDGVRSFGNADVRNLRQLLAVELGLTITAVVFSPARYAWQLMEKLSPLAQDLEVWVSKWCRDGWPLGIVHPSAPCGVFPTLAQNTTAVETLRH